MFTKIVPFDVTMEACNNNVSEDMIVALASDYDEAENEYYSIISIAIAEETKSLHYLFDHFIQDVSEKGRTQYPKLQEISTIIKSFNVATTAIDDVISGKCGMFTPNELENVRNTLTLMRKYNYIFDQNNDNKQTSNMPPLHSFYRIWKSVYHRLEKELIFMNWYIQ